MQRADKTVNLASSLHFLIVVNSETSGPGLFLPWLEDEGVRAVIVAGEEIPDTPDGYDAVVLLGGGYLPTDDERAPWLVHERLLTQLCVRDGVPLLGICLGAQLLAVATGGEVEGDYGQPERGVSTIRRIPRSLGDLLFTGLDDEIVVLQNHRDRVSRLPDGAELLAASDACPIQAFRIGSAAWGVQFHPEAPVTRLNQWDASSLRKEGLDLGALQASAAEYETELTSASRRILANFVAISRGVAAERSGQIIDGHNDLVWEMRQQGLDPNAFGSGLTEVQTDLPRMRAGNMAAQFWSVWVPDETVGPLKVTIEQIARVRELADLYHDDLVLTASGAAVRQIMRDGKIASLIGAEGAHCLEGDLRNVERLARAGVRYMTLTHNTSNTWADSGTGDRIHGGLSLSGQQLVAEMERVGMLVDLSHTSVETMRDVLDRATAPVIFSHSSTYSLTQHPRNVPDKIMRRMSRNGGVQMITFVPQFVSEEYRQWNAQQRPDVPFRPVATLADVADHIEHACDVAGIANVGIGGDFDGITETPTGLNDVGDYPALLSVLRGRGWTPAELAALSSGNIIRVLERTDAASIAGLGP